MAYKLTQRAKSIADSGILDPNIVLEIDGVDYKIGMNVPLKTPRYGDDELFYGMDDLVYGGLVKITGVKDYIDKDGTTDTITQQLEPDKGSVSSVQSVNLRITDINQEITKLISPSFEIDEIIYRNCRLWIGDSKSSFPEDYIEVFNGKVQTVKGFAGHIDLTIVHPDDITRGEAFVKAETNLVQTLDYYSAEIGDLYYRNRGDVTSAVTIVYQYSSGIGDDANIVVTGNIIYVNYDTALVTGTKAKTIKKKLEEDIDAMQLISVSISGDGDTIQSYLGSTVLSVETEIFVSDVTQFLPEIDPIFRTYARVGDEIIRYTGIDTVNSKLTGCTRATLNSIGSIHEIGDEVTSFYKLGDNTTASNAITLALYLLMSAGDEWYKLNLEITSISYISPSRTEDNALFFSGVDLTNLYNVQVGDTVRSSGNNDGANDYSARTITDIEVDVAGTILFVDGAPLVIDTDPTGIVDLKSQYNILPDGAGLEPSQVDIDQFMNIFTTYFSGLAEYEFYFKDTVQIKNFINEQVYFPSGLYSLPRKGKVSLGYTSPPLYSDDTKTLTLDTVKNPSKLSVTRSINKNFYNSVVYKYNQDSVDDKYLAANVTYSAESVNRIAAPNRPMKIESEGLRPNAQNLSIIEINSIRFLEKYKFAAESIPVEVPFNIGWSVEVGDSIIFGDDRFSLPDSKSGNRNFKPRIFQIVNKSFNWKTSHIRLDILDTGYSLTYRSGTWSPSSMVGSGSTSNKIMLTKSFGYTGTYEPEKWANHIGRSIIAHDENYLFTYTSKVIGLDPSNQNALLVEPMAGAPLVGWILDVPEYDNLLVTDDLYKQIFPFWTPTLDVVAGISSTQFTLSPSDAAKVFVGSIVRVHNEDYATDSGKDALKVTDITGVTITCDDLGFTPSAGQKVDFIGFVSDEGIPYVWL